MRFVAPEPPWDGLGEVLSTREAHASLAVQGFYRGPVSRCALRPGQIPAPPCLAPSPARGHIRIRTLPASGVQQRAFPAGHFGSINCLVVLTQYGPRPQVWEKLLSSRVFQGLKRYMQEPSQGLSWGCAGLEQSGLLS